MAFSDVIELKRTAWWNAKGGRGINYFTKPFCADPVRNRLKEFCNIDVSVSVMNKSITVLLTELDELKSQKSGTECWRELVEQPQSEPLSKRPRTQHMENWNGSEDQDPIDTYMQGQEDGNEMDDSEEEDIVSDLSQFFTDVEEMGPQIGEELAKIANSAIRVKPQLDKLKNWLKNTSDQKM